MIRSRAFVCLLILIGVAVGWLLLRGPDRPGTAIEAKPAPKHASKSRAIRVVSIPWPKEPAATPKKAPEAPKELWRQSPETFLHQPKPASPKVLSPRISPESRPQAAGGTDAGQTGGWNMVAEFTCPVEFYLRRMRALGAETFLYELGGKKLFKLGTDGSTWSVDRIPEGYAAMAGRLTDDHPDAVRIQDEAETRWGPGHYEIIIVRPLALELRLNGIVADAVKRHTKGVTSQPVETVEIEYGKSGERLQLTIRAFHAGGQEIQVQEKYPL